MANTINSSQLECPRTRSATASPAATRPRTRKPTFFNALMKSSPRSYISVSMTPSQILVVEDDARLAATLERVLATEGHGLMLAGDEKCALRLARAGAR